MRGMSSFQVKARVITIFLSIILIIGGCSSSRGEKNPKEPEKEEAPATEQASVIEQSTAEVSKIASEEDAALFLMGDAGKEDDSHYAIATRTYSFDAKEEYNVMPLGHSTYLLEYPDEFYEGYLMSVSEDQKTITVSGLGCTDEYTIE